MSLWSWLNRRRLGLDENDFQEEIRAHLAIAEQDRIDRGADRETARYSARRDFGNLTLTTEAARQVWKPRWLEALNDFISDLRYAVRSLARTPGFTLIVIGVLMVGITLNATVFAMLKGLALTPLSGVERSSQLHVVMRETEAGQPLRLSYPDFTLLREHQRAFGGLMGSMFKLEQYRLGKGQSSRTASVEFVTGNYFEVLGVKAALGRTLLPIDEGGFGAHPVVVISHGLWRREYGGNADLIGRTIEINRYPLTVVGVAEAGFHGTIPLYDNDLFIPIVMAAEVGVVGVAGANVAPSPHLLADRGAALLTAHGFLRPEVTRAAAVDQMAGIWATRAREPSTDRDGERLTIIPFWRSPVGPQTYMLPMLVSLTVMGSLVLLIACANLAGLVLARGASRRGELAARLALGASRSRIVRLLTVETLTLVMPSIVLGILVAQRAIRVFVAYLETLSAPQRLFLSIEIDGVTVAFAALVTALCAIVFGFVPALQTSRVNLVSVLNEDASPRGAGRARVRAGLVTAQVAISLVLLIGAGLLTRSLDQVRRIDPGYDDRGAMLFPLDLQQHGYSEARGRVFYRNLMDALRADSAVESATLAQTTPLSFLEPLTAPLAIDGYAPHRGEDLAAAFNIVTSDYFRTLGVGLVAGREFDARDAETGHPVAIVNRTFAERFWGSAQGALGQRIRTGGGSWRTVVGVAADVKYVRMTEASRLYFYLPLEQGYRPIVTLHARPSAAGAGLTDRVRAHIAALDADLPSPTPAPLSDVRRVALLLHQITAAMLLVFGATGMVLAGLGTYGLVSHTVTQSTREIGIRMALGATAPAVVRAFVGRGLRLAAIGIGIGLVTALGASRLLGSLLFGVSATDGVSFGQALALVIGGVALATLVPAWRASRIQPLIALRHS
jgi:predicted permease